MTSAEYFSFERSRIVGQVKGAHIEEETARQFNALGEQEREKDALLPVLEPGVHWVTFHWLVPYGTGVRAHSIVGTVKSKHRKGVDIWVKSRPEPSETKIHGISQGDIVSVPMECVTCVSNPLDDLYPEGGMSDVF